MIRRPPRSTQSRSSAASDVYKRQGINEPRYVSIMGIRKASKVERKVLKASDYQENVENMIELTRWVYPLKKEGATLLSPDLENACKELLNILKEKGVYQ